MFVQEYLLDLNAAKAALRSGYSPRSAKQIGMENLTKPTIAFAIAAAMAQRREEIEVTQAEVIQELAAIAFANIADVAEWSGGSVKVLDSATRPKTALAAVAQVSETAHGIAIRMHDKRAALVDLGKHLGMFREKVDLEVRDGTPVLEWLTKRLDAYSQRHEGVPIEAESVESV